MLSYISLQFTLIISTVFAQNIESLLKPIDTPHIPLCECFDLTMINPAIIMSDSDKICYSYILTTISTKSYCTDQINYFVLGTGDLNQCHLTLSDIYQENIIMDYEPKSIYTMDTNSDGTYVTGIKFNTRSPFQTDDPLSFSICLDNLIAGGTQQNGQIEIAQNTNIHTCNVPNILPDFCHFMKSKSNNLIQWPKIQPRHLQSGEVCRCNDNIFTITHTSTTTITNPDRQCYKYTVTRNTNTKCAGDTLNYFILSHDRMDNTCDQLWTCERYGNKIVDPQCENNACTAAVLTSADTLTSSKGIKFEFASNAFEAGESVNIQFCVKDVSIGLEPGTISYSGIGIIAMKCDYDAPRWCDNTYKPTNNPTPSPTSNPSPAPTDNPIPAPTKTPSTNPSKFPTKYPTITPSVSPTKYPTKFPTNNPSSSPTKFPTSPSSPPSTAPSSAPTSAPSYGPCSTTDALNVAFLLDESGSVSTAEWTQMKKFVAQVIGNNLSPSTYAAVWEYASLHAFEQIRDWSPMSSERQAVISSVRQNSYNKAGETYTWDATNRVLDAFWTYRKTCSDGCDTRSDMMFLVTDGAPSDVVCDRMIKRVNQSDVDIIIIGIGTGSNSPRWAQQIECLDYKDKGSDIVFVQGFDSLMDKTTEGWIRARTCSGNNPAGPSIRPADGSEWVYEDGSIGLGPVPTGAADGGGGGRKDATPSPIPAGPPAEKNDKKQNENEFDNQNAFDTITNKGGPFYKSIMFYIIIGIIVIICIGIGIVIYKRMNRIKREISCVMEQKAVEVIECNSPTENDVYTPNSSQQNWTTPDSTQINVQTVNEMRANVKYCE